MRPQEDSTIARKEESRILACKGVTWKQDTRKCIEKGNKDEREKKTCLRLRSAVPHQKFCRVT